MRLLGDGDAEPITSCRDEGGVGNHSFFAEGRSAQRDEWGFFDGSSWIAFRNTPWLKGR